MFHLFHTDIPCIDTSEHKFQDSFQYTTYYKVETKTLNMFKNKTLEVNH